MDFPEAIERCEMLVQLGRAIPANEWLGDGAQEPDLSWANKLLG